MTNYCFMGKATPTVQKRINRSLIFHYILEHSPCHRAMIAKDLRLSAPAVSRAVESLLKRKDIIETQKTQLKNGKRAAQLAFNAVKGFVLGIDLLRSPMQMIIADLAGHIVCRKSGFSMDRETDITNDLKSEIEQIINVFLASYNDVPVNSASIKVISIGIPATINKETGVISGTQRYDYMLGHNYAETLSRELHIPVIMENVTNLAATAERRRGRSHGKSHSVFFEISEGVGLGIFINGQLFTGVSGAAGEIGYSPISRENLHTRKKNGLGFLEQAISMHGIAEKAVEAGLTERKEKSEESVAAVFSLAKKGDPRAYDIVSSILENLILVCTHITLLLNPEQIIIGGTLAGVPYLDELLLTPLRDKLYNLIPFPCPEIELSALGEDSGLIGAVQAGIEYLIVSAYPYRMDESSSATS